METADGEIIAVGNTDGASQGVYAMMLDVSGSFVNYWSGQTHVTLTLPITINSIAIMAGDLQSDGSIIIAGYLTSPDFIGENMVMLRLVPYVDLTSVNELTKESITVYPNPAERQFKIDLDDINNVKLISSQGQVVSTWEAQSAYELPHNLVPGVYMVHVETTNSFGVTRLMIK